MKIALLSGIFFLFFLSVVHASATAEPFTPGSVAHVEALCLENSQPLLSGANITIFYPNNTIFINNTAYNLTTGGIYRYDFTAPQVAGNYLVYASCTGLGVDIGTFAVREDEFVSLSAVLGLAFVIVFFFLIGYYFLAKPLNVDEYTTTIKKYLNIKTFGLFILLGTSWLLIPFVTLLYTISAFSFFSTLTVLMLIIVPMFNLFFIVFYIISVIYTEWGVKNKRYNSRI